VASQAGRVKRIFVGGLKTTTEESVVREFFSRFGTISVIDSVEDKVTRKKKGFAYVTFSDFDAVDKACRKLLEIT